MRSRYKSGFGLWQWLLPLLLALLLNACAARPFISPAASLAQGASQRGAAAFARGDLVSAEREYRRALYIHDSLGDTAGRAATLLSISRVASQAGRPSDAMVAVQQVLDQASGLPMATVVTAHGRAAGLFLGQNNLLLTAHHLDAADKLCAKACHEAAALTVLRARAALAGQQPAAALQWADDALAIPALRMAAQPGSNSQAGAERANAMRVRAEALLSLGQARAALDSATAALTIDQTLGLADRVLADLKLLTLVHAALGDETLARRSRLLADRAESAALALRVGPQPD